jgi:hypothetical protein
MTRHRRLAFWLYLAAMFALFVLLNDTSRWVRLPVAVIGIVGLLVMFWRIDPTFFRQQLGVARVSTWIRSRR